MSYGRLCPKLYTYVFRLLSTLFWMLWIQLKLSVHVVPSNTLGYLPTTSTGHYTICCKNISVLRSWRLAKACPKHVELILKINKTVIVASSWCSIFTLPRTVKVLYSTPSSVYGMCISVYWRISSCIYCIGCWFKSADRLFVYFRMCSEIVTTVLCYFKYD
jgi:hypothetical protein